MCAVAGRSDRFVAAVFVGLFKDLFALALGGRLLLVAAACAFVVAGCEAVDAATTPRPLKSPAFVVAAMEGLP